MYTVSMLSCSVVSDSVTSGTVAHQTPLSMGFPRQKYWSGLPFPSLGNLPNPGIKPVSPALTGKLFTAELTGKLPDHVWNPCPLRWELGVLTTGNHQGSAHFLLYSDTG